MRDERKELIFQEKVVVELNTFGRWRIQQKQLKN